MKTSDAGKVFIAKNEGLCLTVRPDNRGPQIGHGHDLTPVEQKSQTVYGIDVSNGITQAQADFILDQDMATIYDPALARMLPPTATQNQWNACADFIYNEGAAHFATMLHHGWDQVPFQMPAWVYGAINGVETKLPGLVARRAAEVVLFTS
jgi:lysozyme